MKLIAKKIPAILISFFLATNAYGNAALRAILKGPRGPWFLERTTGVPKNQIESLNTRKRISLYEEKMASSWNIRKDASSSDGANIEEIGEALALSVFIGNVPLYRKQMFELLNATLPELNLKKQKGVFSEEILQMMYQHPSESVRDLFRRELYDLVNHLHKIENPESSSPLLELPKEHISLFKEHIPKVTLEETPLGRAIINDDAHEFIESYNDLLKNGSVKALLSQAYAKSRSGEGLHRFAIEHISPVNLALLKDAVGSNSLLMTPEFKMAINKFGYLKPSDAPVYLTILGALAGIPTMAMIAPSAPDQAIATIGALGGLITGAVTGALFGKIKLVIQKARARAR